VPGVWVAGKVWFRGRMGIEDTRKNTTGYLRFLKTEFLLPRVGRVRVEETKENTPEDRRRGGGCEGEDRGCIAVMAYCYSPCES